jgi:GT2 family glycosyltransferase
VTSALQFIRWETLDQVGFYDDGYVESLGDVDYCLRVFRADQEVIYEPSIVAIDHKIDIAPAMRPDDLKRRLAVCKERMWRLWSSEDLARWVPEVL